MASLNTQLSWKVVFLSVVASLATNLLFFLFGRLIEFIDLKGRLALVVSELTLNGGILELASEQGVLKGKLSLKVWEDSRLGLARFLDEEEVIALQNYYYVLAVLNGLFEEHFQKYREPLVLTPEQLEKIREQLWKTITLIEILRSYSGWKGLLPGLRKRLPRGFPPA
jgi:hypothetical protein